MLENSASVVKNIILICVTAVISAAIGALSVHAQRSTHLRKGPVAKRSIGHYHVVHGWPVLPENSILDEVSAVAVNSSGNVLVLQRGGRKWPESDVLDQTPIGVPTVFVFDGSTGRLLRKWGANLFALPHSVTVDRQDNVWITDVALNQVFK